MLSEPRAPRARIHRDCVITAHHRHEPPCITASLLAKAKCLYSRPMSCRRLVLHSPVVRLRCEDRPQILRLTNSQQEWRKKSSNWCASTLIGVAWTDTNVFQMATVFVVCVKFFFHLDCILQEHLMAAQQRHTSV